ncbi:MAG: DMT family transporter [Pseudomonadota bacterium]
MIAGGTDTPDRPGRAALFLVSGLLLLAVQDALVKATSDAVSLWQFQFVRALCNLALLLAVGALWRRARAVRPIRLWAVAVRSALIAGTMVLFFGAIPFLSLAEVAAGLYCFPIFVTLLALVLPGEQVGWRRLSAVGVGILGSLMVLQPGAEGFRAIQLMPVGAGVCYACFVLVTRRLCRHEHPATLSMGVLIGQGVLGIVGLSVLTLLPQPALETAWPYLFSGWHALGPQVLAIIVACSAMNLTAQVGLAFAYQNAESSWLAPFDYSYLVFATLVSGLVFGDWPNALAIAGMVLIATSGTAIALREARIGRRVVPRPGGRL